MPHNADPPEIVGRVVCACARATVRLHLPGTAAVGGDRQAETDEDLDFNPFFVALSGKYSKLYAQAQAQRCLICIPSAEALQGVAINQQVIECHVFKVPGPATAATIAAASTRSPHALTRAQRALNTPSTRPNMPSRRPAADLRPLPARAFAANANVGCWLQECRLLTANVCATLTLAAAVAALQRLF